MNSRGFRHAIELLAAEEMNRNSEYLVELKVLPVLIVLNTYRCSPIISTFLIAILFLC